MNKILIYDISVGIITLLCIAISLYKEKIISFIPNSLLHPSKLIKQIIAAFFVIFSLGTIAFIITVKYFSLETLNSYFSLLSSLTTIFAAFVAIFVTKDFREQKRAELLNQFAPDTIEQIRELYNIINTIKKEFETSIKSVESYKNFNELDDLLKLQGQYEDKLTLISTNVLYI